MTAFAPPQQIIDAVARQCPACWPFLVGSVRNLRLSAPVTLTSWYRNPEANLAAGGQPTSQHLIATALDLDGPGADDAARQLRNAGWTWISEGDHEHVQIFLRNPFEFGRVF